LKRDKEKYLGKGGVERRIGEIEREKVARNQESRGRNANLLLTIPTPGRKPRGGEIKHIK